jgi:hypothetical protein
MIAAIITLALLTLLVATDVETENNYQ